jgi:hypothetical protein
LTFSLSLAFTPFLSLDENITTDCQKVST